MDTRTRNKRHTLAAYVLLLSLSVYVSAQNADMSVFTDVPCEIISQISEVLTVIVPALALLMFVYGAAAYAMAADDPGARKKAKAVMIAVIMGGILYVLFDTIFDVIKDTWWGDCSAVAP